CARSQRTRRCGPLARVFRRRPSRRAPRRRGYPACSRNLSTSGVLLAPSALLERTAHLLHAEPDPRLDRAQRLSELVGDLLLGQAAEVGERDGQLLFLWQQLQRLAY